MKKKKNLNLELRLFPPSISDICPTMKEEEESESPQEDHQQQYRPLTIVYDGKISVTDATEIQARSILMLAKKEMVRTPTGSSSEPSSPSVFNLYSPSTSLSMQKSLQRFLQKRKNRIQEASPYHLKINQQN
ncbi:putative transcription factor TIFY family [Medicago truncatula]|uniref:Putative transcription factor TIFY family n=1 Tax=Medicago truncatula TaxID=3880 RepID=A0A396GSB0_MEDTR|nr:protein TIFY 5A-like [Medicago truncatula]RHN42394.1 putative transcription factor TIFY family [Medicago truncatula]